MTSITEHTQEIKQQFGHILNGRIEAGQTLALTGKVTQVDADHWQVASQSEPGKFYRVSWSGAWSCQCKDFTGEGYHPAPTLDFGGATEPVCKHIIAASLVYFSGETPVAPAADLAISVKKTPLISEANGRILWIKKAGCDRVEPKSEKHLSDSDIQAKLAKYQLLDTEARSTEIIRRYRLLQVAA